MRLFKWALLGILMAMGSAMIYYLDHALPIGTGYSAKYVCSQVFLAGRDPDSVFQRDVLPTNALFHLVRPVVDYKNQSVTSTALGFWKPMTAVYRKGCGCTLAVGTDRGTLMAQTRGLRAPTPPPRNQPWPRGEAEGIGPLPPGVDPNELDRALDEFFAEPGPNAQRNTQAVVIVMGDHIIAERYAPQFSRETPMLGWSMSKSVTSALVGILVGDGQLDLYTPAPVKEWQDPKDPRHPITLDMLLRMSSGLAFTEKYAPFKDATTMLYNSTSMAAYAAAHPLAFPLDTHWSYSSGTTNILSGIVTRTLGNSLAKTQNFARTRLFDKIGAESALMEPDAQGGFVGSSYMFATARDWARFGLLMKNKGVWNGEQILPKGWVDYVTTPTPQAPQGKYGGQFWLNAGAPHHPQDRLFPSLPRDIYYCGGFNGQIVAIVPSKDMVLVRLGVTHHKPDFSREWFIKRTLEAVTPKDNPSD